MFPYHTTFRPPAPALEVEVINSQTGMIETILAKIDTAADASVIPDILVQRLGLLDFDQFLAISFDGSLQLQSSYLVDLLVAGRKFTDLEVITTPLPYILLGRDVLNQLVITCDGPRLAFEIQ